MLVNTNTHTPGGTVGWDLISSRFQEVARREEIGWEVFPTCDSTPLTSQLLSDLCLWTSDRRTCWNHPYFAEKRPSLSGTMAYLGSEPGKNRDLCLKPGVFASWDPGCSQTFPGGLWRGVCWGHCVQIRCVLACRRGMRNGSTVHVGVQPGVGPGRGPKAVMSLP